MKSNFANQFNSNGMMIQPSQLDDTAMFYGASNSSYSNWPSSHNRMCEQFSTVSRNMAWSWKPPAVQCIIGTNPPPLSRLNTTSNSSSGSSGGFSFFNPSVNYPYAMPAPSYTQVIGCGREQSPIAIPRMKQLSQGMTPPTMFNGVNTYATCQYNNTHTFNSPIL
ncbi:unnamed protein product [Soboliphyme baturini]|uniref:OAR domain-containing protein n=1 Tax=Soboliphyme baturini TaxID=241478 RepID=A0A183ISK8_9BILA|nr:unnamed protein product [Soboliphyme baturini]